MAQVDVAINGRTYQVNCDDGEEDHLRGLADYVDRKVGELVTSVGQVGESRLMLMVALVVADELAGTVDKLETAERELAHVAEDKSVGLAAVDDTRIAFDAATRRVEAIVASVKSS
ncbi:MAG: cell division protein ZapA [Alphaproteobacteria bacterium]|nr:cell division protein ZapA [Alphaproteobacteria bacterium]